MQGLYLIRHGNADYRKNRLTGLGQQQVKDLSSKLHSHLPDNQKYLLISSPSGRAYETAEGLVQLVRQKACNEVHIKKDENFSELNSMWFDDEMFEVGRQRIPLIESYGESCDILLITAHEKIIAATGIAIADKYGIQLPKDFGRIKAYREEYIEEYVKEYDLPRHKVVEKLGEIFPDELPHIPEASAVFCNFDAKQVEIVYHNI